MNNKLSPRRSDSFFTLGYQHHSPASLWHVLAKNGVTVLIDVRQNPISRKPGFSKHSLEERSARIGIKYLHLPCLGTPPAIRKLYCRSGNVERALQKYEQFLQWRIGCLDSLIRIATSNHCCLLCLESDYTSCHRSVIASRLTEMTGWRSVHLT